MMPRFFLLMAICPISMFPNTTKSRGEWNTHSYPSQSTVRLETENPTISKMGHIDNLGPIEKGIEGESPGRTH